MSQTPWWTRSYPYPPMFKYPKFQAPPPPHTNARARESHSYIGCYMNEVISVVQDGPERQHQVFDGTVCALKWIFPSLPGEYKDLVSIKKLLAGEGDWTCVKEVLGWTIYTEAVTVALLKCKLRKLLTLVDIPAMHHHMGRKELERLVGKLHSMHLSVPGLVEHFYHIQCVLSQRGVYRSWMLLAFHCDITDWRALAVQISARPTHLADIVRREPTHLGLCNASGLGAGDVWLDPARFGRNLVWCHPCPPNIISYLVSLTNLGGNITNSDLELAALVLHEATLLAEVPTARMAAPRSGSDNMPTVLWSMCKALTINLVVAELLCICALHSRQFFLNPSIFITQGNKITWRTMPLAFSNFLTPHFSSTCLPHTHIRTVRGRSPSCHRNCFPAWSPRCAGSRANGH